MLSVSANVNVGADNTPPTHSASVTVGAAGTRSSHEVPVNVTVNVAVVSLARSHR